MGLLEVILGDFEKSVEKTGDDEDEAQSKYEEFEKESNESMDKKTSDKDDKLDDVAKAEDDINEAKDNIIDAKKLRDNSEVELEKLKVMCVEGASSWEERQKKREEEIDALKMAKGILEDSTGIG